MLGIPFRQVRAVDIDLGKLSLPDTISILLGEIQQIKRHTRLVENPYLPPN